MNAEWSGRVELILRHIWVLHLYSAASEVLLLIWEGQPRHACQAHWGMDSNAAALLSVQKKRPVLG
jgi:hypothetical protein